MIYYSADDWGLCEEGSRHIEECTLDKVSVFPNFDRPELSNLLEKKDMRVSLHLNLVEGKCMSDPEKIPLLTNTEGIFKNTFVGLLALSLFRRGEFQRQVLKEIRAQVLYWKELLPENVPFCVDSHQHTHMIPAVFKTLVKVLREEKICVEYMRIPAEPLSPFLKTPAVLLSVNPANALKHFLLKFLNLFNKKYQKNIPTALFFGILFSGKMDMRVLKVLPAFLSLAKKKGMDAEVLFHPAYVSELKTENVVFHKFYLSENRKTEFDTVKKISERSVL